MGGYVFRHFKFVDLPLLEFPMPMRAILYSLTLLLSSFLLFLVQPMVGRMLLPSLGGTPAVWNGCMLFFQATLLAGYAWAHYGPNRLGLRNHMLMHLMMLTAVCFVLPIQLWAGWSVPVDGNPMGWLLGQLFLCVGAPFFVVSSSAPLLQRWFSIAGPEGDAKDPWFLYAISNVGSLTALIGYPFVFERVMGLTGQGLFWAGGFLLLAVMFGLCAWQVLKHASPDKLVSEFAQQPAPPIAWKQRLRFITLAAIPSSLMLGVTTIVSTEVGSFPLMWSIPLALYLLTFVFVFAKRALIPHRLMVRLMPILLLMMPFLAMVDLAKNPVVMISLHFASFFVVSMACHGELARLRPRVEQLTEFYLMMSIGGVVGGILNSLLAPALFTGILEYPLALVAACVTMPTLTRLDKRNAASTDPEAKPKVQSDIRSWQFWSLPAAIAVVLAGSALLSNAQTGLPDSIYKSIVFGVPTLICFSMIATPKRFAIGYAMIAFACPLLMKSDNVVCQQRGFFGVNKVVVSPDGENRILVNGRTLHGMQRIDESDNPQPLTYYHRQGPVGDLFEIYGNDQKKVAAVGLGVGSLAAYCQPGQHFDFFEIDPVVVELASDTNYFNFLSSAKGDVDVILGDARIQLEAIRTRRKPTPLTQVALAGEGQAGLRSLDDENYGLIILDAFGSDAVPIHLMTYEAMELYLDLLKEDGLLVLHISSNFIDLEQVAFATTEKLGLHAAIKTDTPTAAEKESSGRQSCRYIVVSRDEKLVGEFLEIDRGWRPLSSDRPLLWTDEHANVLDAMVW